MGREARGQAVFGAAQGDVTAVLEGDCLILRGALRRRFARAALNDWRVAGDDLCLVAEGEPLVLRLGAVEAASWLRALQRPVPSLAAKLGLGPAARAWLIGSTQAAPAELAAALDGAGAERPAQAAMLIAVLATPADLATALARGGALGLPVWCVHGKGKGAAVGEAAVRAAFRAAGWRDTKVCAVAAAWTATRYTPGAA